MCSFNIGVSKATLWITWIVVTVIAAVYVVLSLKTFAKVNQAYEDAEDADNQTVAVLVASFAGAAIVLVFSVISFLTLLMKQVTANFVGFTYGFMNASALNQCLICFLCSLVLYSFHDDISVSLSRGRSPEDYSWSSTDTDIFKATYWFGFITALGYFALFLVMYLASFTINRQTSRLQDDEV